jgi:hypothetical protein
MRGEIDARATTPEILSETPTKTAMPEPREKVIRELPRRDKETVELFRSSLAPQPAIGPLTYTRQKV